MDFTLLLFDVDLTPRGAFLHTGLRAMHSSWISHCIPFNFVDSKMCQFGNNN